VEKNEIDGIEDYHDEVEDRWERYLNWSTEDNPDGVGIVHDAIDQVGVVYMLCCVLLLLLLVFTVGYILLAIDCCVKKLCRSLFVLLYS
jgi:hypothetical protein